LEGKALHRHTAVARFAPYFPMLSWKQYTKVLIDRFGELGDDPMAELMRLRQ